MAQKAKAGITTQVASIAIALIGYIIVSSLLDSLIDLPWYVRAWNKVKGIIKECGIMVEIWKAIYHSGNIGATFYGELFVHCLASLGHLCLLSPLFSAFYYKNTLYGAVQ